MTYSIISSDCSLDSFDEPGDNLLDVMIQASRYAETAITWTALDHTEARGTVQGMRVAVCEGEPSDALALWVNESDQ